MGSSACNGWEIVLSAESSASDYRHRRQHWHRVCMYVYIHVCMYELLCMQRLGNCLICRIVGIGIILFIWTIIQNLNNFWKHPHVFFSGRPLAFWEARLDYMIWRCSGTSLGGRYYLRISYIPMHNGWKSMSLFILLMWILHSWNWLISTGGWQSPSMSRSAWIDVDVDVMLITMID